MYVLFHESVSSFAIAINKVSDIVVRYWLDKASGYPVGGMKAAYGTFLASLLLIRSHDMVADEAAGEFNVTWSRSSPVVVSVCDDAQYTYLTLECSHRMGMDVVGDAASVWAFRFACSSVISPLENQVMASIVPDGSGPSVNPGSG